MAEKKKVRVPIIRMEQLEDAIYDMTIEEKEMAAAAKAGQFLSLYLDDESRLLPRPISICGIDKEAGTISVNPDAPVKTRYTSYYSVEEDRYLGYEASAAIVDHYLYTSENGGLFHCIDLNTMELVWAQDTKDDSNSSPVFEWSEDGEGYLYTAPSLHWTPPAISS